MTEQEIKNIVKNANKFYKDFNNIKDNTQKSREQELIQINFIISILEHYYKQSQHKNYYIKELLRNLREAHTDYYISNFGNGKYIKHPILINPIFSNLYFWVVAYINKDPITAQKTKNQIIQLIKDRYSTEIKKEVIAEITHILTALKENINNW